ncbi:hypothetical protein JMJ58_18085 [Haloterrigena salifodinae]|uniref:Uncharacterized protein n=1 Tax=Haloterrigena salifodinae TaxID=2675099 RepID=A0A8T8DZK9_9EURY|nr:hypothetical protein [Haloterrigena salifodinae]QRV14807.1 hypothetical protein JMJ58_18085 [Haloterrigena salifodinae]
MSDQSSNQPSAADSASDSSESVDDAGASSGSLEPGGGPQRVVSDQSVDDILDSLDATKSGSADADEDATDGDEPTGAGNESEPDDAASAADEPTAAPAPSEPTDSTTEADDETAATADGPTETDGDVTTAFDEEEIPSTDERGADEVAVGSVAESADPIESTETAASADVTDAARTTDSASTTGSSTDESSIDSAATSLEDLSDDDASLEELAARIEDGAVTGADVRAAEAGEGRESTPDVDEIELSMDDLEETQAATTSAAGSNGAPDVPDDAGPLAGSVGAGEDSSDDDADGDDSPGLLGRIKRFFGG